MLAAYRAWSRSRGLPETVIETQWREFLQAVGEPVTSRIEADVLAAGWQRLGARTNTRLAASTEAHIMGRNVRTRQTFAQASPGRYNYVVDTEGNLWLGPWQENHSSLLPANAQARVAGEVVIKANGEVFVNSRSGHFMDNNGNVVQTLSATEAAIYEEMWRLEIANTNRSVGAIYSGTTALPAP
jgi:hypothetical protein